MSGFQLGVALVSVACVLVAVIWAQIVRERDMEMRLKNIIENERFIHVSRERLNFDVLKDYTRVQVAASIDVFTENHCNISDRVSKLDGKIRKLEAGDPYPATQPSPEIAS
jgi:hypothetical protein